MAEYQRRELGPDEVWLEGTDWYLDLTSGMLIHDVERLGMLSVSPTVLLRTALVRRGENTSEGTEVLSPTATWFEVSRQLKLDPDFRFEFTSNPTKFEEFLAGAYKLQGWEAVTLTPRSGDRGRDVIAITSQLSAMRVLDQAKANSPTHLVSQNDVRAIFGVLRLDAGATKGVITTTSDFAPGVAEEFQKVIPYQLETKNGEQFLEWIRKILGVQEPDAQPPDSKWVYPETDAFLPWVIPRSRRPKPDQLQ
jgi:restriction system protein